MIAVWIALSVVVPLLVMERLDALIYRRERPHR
jgi:hypothetical protein